MDIILYHSPGACSMAPYISLLQAGAEFKVEIVSLRNNEQMSEEYAALNPKKKVPYLSVDGRGLTENVAIQCWIAQTFPKANILPMDSWDYVRAISYMGWFGSGMHPHITRHFKTGKFCSVEEAEADIKSKAKAMLFEQFALVEQELEGRTWFFDHPTACDNYFLWVYERSLREGFDLSEFENCTAHNNRMREQAVVQKVMAHKAG
jgi:glutathione S-transferase